MNSLMRSVSRSWLQSLNWLLFFEWIRRVVCSVNLYADRNLLKLHENVGCCVSAAAFWNYWPTALQLSTLNRWASHLMYCLSAIVQELRESPIMIHKDVKIVANAENSLARCSVKSETLLSDFADDHLNTPHAYVVVEDGMGQPVGIVAVDEIRQRLSSPNFSERRRWQNMPIEAALNGRLSTPASLVGTQSFQFSQEFQCSPSCTALLQGQKMVAIVTPDDVLVSWRSVEQMVRRSESDHVTGLPMRATFDAHLRAECDRAKRDRQSVAVILIDVDYLKNINDQFGHAAGDAVLGAIGKNLRSTFRSYDMVARYGGDEFAVLCCGCRPGEIQSTIDRLRKGMQRLHSLVTIPRPVATLSIGACVVHDLSLVDSVDQIIESADECLYSAKNEGRNRSFFTEIGIESAAVC